MDKKEISTQPKPTWYNNYYFRSKLEAKWAVLFDHMKITWEYEPETFICDDKTQYTPDFYLPNSYMRDDKGLFLEIKPEGFNDPDYIRRIITSLEEDNLALVCGDPFRVIVDESYITRGTATAMTSGGLRV